MLWLYPFFYWNSNYMALLTINFLLTVWIPASFPFLFFISISLHSRTKYNEWITTKINIKHYLYVCTCKLWILSLVKFKISRTHVHITLQSEKYLRHIFLKLNVVFRIVFIRTYEKFGKCVMKWNLRRFKTISYKVKWWR